MHQPLPWTSASSLTSPDLYYPVFSCGQCGESKSGGVSGSDPGDAGAARGKDKEEEEEVSYQMGQEKVEKPRGQALGWLQRTRLVFAIRLLVCLRGWAGRMCLGVRGGCLGV